MGASFHILTGLWGVAMIATFIQAVRLSYRIEGARRILPLVQVFRATL